MLRKIYEELTSIRKELQAIRSSLEPNRGYTRIREPYSTNYKLVKSTAGPDGSLEAR